MAPSASQALSILRDPSLFQWYLIPFLLVVVHMYFQEIGQKNWKVIFAGLAFWGIEWNAELINAVYFFVSGYAPLWATPGDTAYQILIGLNIEISFMFLIMGIAAVKVLPDDKKMKILGLPNRLVIAGVLAVCCILVEAVLNAIGVLTWEYWYWSSRFPVFLFLLGYFPLFVVSYWVYDMNSVKKQAAVTLGIYCMDAVWILLFGVMAKWI